MALVRATASEQDAAIYLTAAFTGLRRGELLAPRWRDVDFAGQVIRVRASYAEGVLTTPKSGKVRSVPMAPDVATALASLGQRERWTGDDDLVFVGPADARGIGVAFRGPAPPLATSLGAGTVVSDLTLTNNDVLPGSAPSGFPLSAIMVEADNQTGAGNKSPTVRADIRGNTVPAGAPFDLLPTQLGFYEYDAANAHGIGQLVDTAPASPDATSQLTSTNTGSASAFGIVLIAGPINTPP